MTNPTPIEICRPGRFTSVQGTTVDFSEADLVQAAAVYDPAGEPAPLVVGHPKLDAPAYGWVDRLSFEGGKLVAYPGDLHPDFAQAVSTKAYRRVSPEFYPPQHPSNPTPGSWNLKHVGFLGASAPAIRGLKPVSFSEAQVDGAITIDIDPKELTMPTEDQTAAFAEREAGLATREAALDTRETEIRQREEAAKAADIAARHDGNVSFAEGLIAGGRLAPAGKAKIVGLLDALGDIAVVSFGEQLGELAPVEVFRELLGTASPIVSFAEAAPAEDEPATTVASFAAPAGYTPDPAALDQHRKALQLQADNPKLTYLDAVKQVG